MCDACVLLYATARLLNYSMFLIWVSRLLWNKASYISEWHMVLAASDEKDRKRERARTFFSLWHFWYARRVQGDVILMSRFFLLTSFYFPFPSNFGAITLCALPFSEKLLLLFLCALAYFFDDATVVCSWCSSYLFVGCRDAHEKHPLDKLIYYLFFQCNVEMCIIRRLTDALQI